MSRGIQKEKILTGIPAALFSFMALYFAIQQNVLAQKPLALPQYQPQIDDDTANFNLDQLGQNTEELLASMSPDHQPESVVEKKQSFNQYNESQLVIEESQYHQGQFETTAYTTDNEYHSARYYSGSNSDAFEIAGVIGAVVFVMLVVTFIDYDLYEDVWWYYDDYYILHEVSYPSVPSGLEVLAPIENNKIYLDYESYQQIVDFERSYDDGYIWVQSIDYARREVLLTTELSSNVITFNDSNTWHVNDISSSDDFSVG